MARGGRKKKRASAKAAAGDGAGAGAQESTLAVAEWKSRMYGNKNGRFFIQLQGVGEFQCL